MTLKIQIDNFNHFKLQNNGIRASLNQNEIFITRYFIINNI